MPQRHLFVVDPLPSLNTALDTSLRLAAELMSLGHEVYCTTVDGLSWNSSEKAARARAGRLALETDIATAGLVGEAVRTLSSFDCIHMRKDPPFDMDYVTATWLLETAVREAHVINAPQTLRSLNEKLAIFMFPEAARPALVSCNADELMHFLETVAGGDAILKPLHLYGGRGVRRLKLGPDGASLEDVVKTLRKETSDGNCHRLIQAFDPAVFEGEVRAFAAFGKPLAWCLKKPAKGSFLANTRAGATLHAYTPTPSEYLRVSHVATELSKKGVDMVGFDLIGGYLSEINITSPRLLQGSEDETNYFEAMATLVVEKAAKSPEAQRKAVQSGASFPVMPFNQRMGGK